MNNDDFYQKLPSFSDFHRLGESVHYQNLPLNWFVVICDIRGSTKAIEAGRYQDVNTLGAAAIAVVQATGQVAGQDIGQAFQIPFVFGGDGASFLVPPSRVKAATDALMRLRSFAALNYSLDMRVALVSMSELHEQGLPIEVAKFSVAQNQTIALIRGGGLSRADEMIKLNPEKYGLTDSQNGAALELSGLSCRWRPLSSKKGAILSLIIKPISIQPGLVDQIVTRFEQIFDGDLRSANPANPQTMKYKSFLQIIRAEFKIETSILSRSFVNRLFSVLISVWAFRWRWPVPFKAETYVKQIPSHSDYRKFDDVLRLILDCTPKQIEEITLYLENLHAQKLICYGLHKSPHALMTCVVETLQEGGHIHFIDGGDGGYALAAKQLKIQLSGLR